MQPLAHVVNFFGEGGWGVAQEKGGLLVGGQGAPIWLAGVKRRVVRSLIRSIATSEVARHSKMRWISESVTPDGQ